MKTRASDSHGPGEIAYDDGPSSWLVWTDMLGRAWILPSQPHDLIPHDLVNVFDVHPDQADGTEEQPVPHLHPHYQKPNPTSL